MAKTAQTRKQASEAEAKRRQEDDDALAARMAAAARDNKPARVKAEPEPESVVRVTSAVARKYVWPGMTPDETKEAVARFVRDIAPKNYRAIVVEMAEAWLRKASRLPKTGDERAAIARERAEAGFARIDFILRTLTLNHIWELDHDCGRKGVHKFAEEFYSPKKFQEIRKRWAQKLL